MAATPDPNAALIAALQQNTQALTALNATMWALGAAITANTQEEQNLMADLSKLTAVAQQIASDDSALKTSIDALVTAFQAAQAGGFTPQNQADLDAAVTALTTAHNDLVADATEATDAVAPPAPAP